MKKIYIESAARSPRLVADIVAKRKWYCGDIGVQWFLRRSKAARRSKYKIIKDIPLRQYGATRRMIAVP